MNEHGGLAVHMGLAGQLDGLDLLLQSLLTTRVAAYVGAYVDDMIS